MKRNSFIRFAALAQLAEAKPAAKRCDPVQELRYDTPQSVGLLAAPLKEAVQNMTSYTVPRNYEGFTDNLIHPIEPGSANIVGHCGAVVSEFAVGKRDLYAGVNGTYLPQWQQEDATIDTIYDMASLTKLYTTVAVLRQLDAKTIDLNQTVVTYIPEFASNGKENVTILELLTHTSGFDSDPAPPLQTYGTYEERVNAILGAPLINAPGAVFLYSDLNFMSLFLVVERVTGRPFDEEIAKFTEPLGMFSTYYNKGNIEGPAFPPWARCATQEFQIAVMGPLEPPRPQPVRGTVHDENAFWLNGVSGHAGLFSTVHDTGIFCQMILNNGTYNGQRILSQWAVDQIFHNYNARFGPGSGHGLGFELDQYYTAGPMAGPETASHTGYTGTTLAIDRPSNTFWLHFANRVHPSRDWSSNNIAREALGYWVAKSLGRDVAFPPL